MPLQLHRIYVKLDFLSNVNKTGNALKGQVDGKVNPPRSEIKPR